MRRIIGLTLIGLGVMFVVLAIAFPTFVYPRVAKVPENPQTRVVAKGTGVTVLLPSLVVKGGNGILTNQEVTSSRYVIGTVPPDGCTLPEGQAYYRQSYNAFVVNPQIASEDALLEAQIEAATIDGLTGETTNACRDYLIEDPTDPIGDPVTHRGLIFKFPFDTQRKNYEWWDSTLKAPVTARFDGTEKIEGLLTYKFVQDISDEVVDQQETPGALLGLTESVVLADRVFSTVRTIWVEPTTGAVIKGSERVNQRLVYLGKEVPVIDGFLEYTPETVQANVEEYGPLAMRLSIVTTYGPIGGWILGPILALIGITLLYFGRRDPDSWDDGWGEDDDADDDAVHRQTV